MRGRCKVKDCTCDGFGEREGSSSFENCGHCPGKHRSIPKGSQASPTLDVTPKESEITHISTLTWFLRILATLWQLLRLVLLPLFGVGTQSDGTAVVCSLEGCQNLRYTDEKGFTHDCCSFSHAMEYQRRKAISRGKHTVHLQGNLSIETTHACMGASDCGLYVDRYTCFLYSAYSIW